MESIVADAIGQEGRQSRYRQALKNLEKYKEEGELTATEHKDVKEAISRGFEDAWDKLVRDPYINAGRWESIPKGPIYDFFMLGASPQVQTSPGKLKKLQKLAGQHPVVDAAIKVFEEIVPIALEIKELKGKIVKKKREAREKEATAAEKRRAMMGSNDVERVRSALKHITEDVREELYKSNLYWLTRVVTKWQEQYDPKNRQTTPWEFYRNSPFNRTLVSRVTERKGYAHDAPHELKDDWKSHIEKEAKTITQSMIDGFVEKNTNKLAPILSTKNNLKELRVVDSDTSTGTIEGTLKLSFEDESSFVVTSKVVWSYSKNGRPFSRYPTTFHNVVFPDGTKMRGRASEERMNTEFIGNE